MDEVAKALNLGQKVVFSDGREIVFRDPPFFSLLALSAVFREAFEDPGVQPLLIADEDESKIPALLEAVQSPSGRKLLCSVFAACSEESPSTFEKLTLTDFLKAVKALQQTVNFEEVKDLFFQLIPSLREEAQEV